MCIQRGVLSQGNNEKCYLKDTAPTPCLRQYQRTSFKRRKEQKPKYKKLAWVSVLVGAKWQEGLLGHSMKQRKPNAQASQSVKGLVANE